MAKKTKSTRQQKINEENHTFKIYFKIVQVVDFTT